VHQLHSVARRWSTAICKQFNANKKSVQCFLLTTLACSADVREYAKQKQVQLLDKSELLKKFWPEQVISLGKLMGVSHF